MKKISLLLYISILATVGFAQQFPLQSQYQFNYSTINPAAVGENDFYSARASFREQWVGLTDIPNATQIFTLTKGYGINGLGITVFNDHTGGAFNKSGASLSYSHKVRLAKSELYFGVAAGAAKINLDATDPAILSSRGLTPEVAFGAFYKIGDLNVGISIPGLLNADMGITESTENAIHSHFYTMISYKKKLSDTWDVYPSLLVKTTANHNQIDANINFKLRNKLWIGTSYRQDFGPTLYVGIDFGRLFSIYSYDVSTNEVSDYSNGSHEFTLGYDFISEEDMEKERENERKIEENLFDKDKDGVDDKYDLCPDVAGDKLANGCPDFDKDGVPDKFDLCPHLFGDVNAQGCPKLSTDESSIITIALENLHFGFDKDIINSDSYASLTRLAVLLHKNPSMFLLIEGYASSEGSTQHNLSLSARRAKAVQKFFIQKGINKNRLVIDFHGENNPVNANNTEEERAKNRRVEFDIKYHLYNADAANILKTEYDSLLNQISTTTILNSQDNTIITTTISTNEVAEEVVAEEVVAEEVVAEEVVAEEVVAEEVVAEEVVAEEVVVEEVVVEEVVVEEETMEGEDPAENNYLVIVQVFSDKANAVNFTTGNDLKYISLNGKYYVYVFASKNRKDAEQFKAEYKNKKDCWIKNPNKI